MRFEVYINEQIIGQLPVTDNEEDILSFFKDKGVCVSLEVANSLLRSIQNSVLRHKSIENSGIEGLFSTQTLDDGTIRLIWCKKTILGFRAFLQNINSEECISQIHLLEYIYGLPFSEIIIPDKVSQISEYCFHSCDGIERVIIPDSVKEIPDFAFWGCPQLKEVIIPESVTIISDGAFCNCKSLTKIKIPSNLKRIGAGAFLGCENLRIITLPNTLTSIGYAAFKDCVSLSKVSIDSDYTILPERYVFEGCNTIDTTGIRIGDFDLNIDETVYELANGLFALAKIYLDGVNSQYFIEIFNIESPDKDEIGVMKEDIDETIADFLMNGIWGGWVFFKDNCMLRNMERISDINVALIASIIANTLKRVHAEVFECTQIIKDKYSANCFDLRGMMLFKAMEKWYVLRIEWAD